MYTEAANACLTSFTFLIEGVSCWLFYNVARCSNGEVRIQQALKLHFFHWLFFSMQLLDTIPSYWWKRFLLPLFLKFYGVQAAHTCSQLKFNQSATTIISRQSMKLLDRDDDGSNLNCDHVHSKWRRRGKLKMHCTSDFWHIHLHAVNVPKA